MFRVLHISDLHFGPGYLPEVGQAVLTLANSISLDLIVASGDFTKRAKKHQYAEARTFLDSLPKAPLIHTPGNHDVPLYRVWERCFAPYANYRAAIGSERDYVTELPAATVVTLNSTRPLKHTVEGELNAAQLDFCEQQFQQSPPDRVRILVTHHPFVQANDGDKEGYCYCPANALARLKQMGVEIIMTGHLHRSFVLNPGPLIVQCGTTTSNRGRGPERGKNTLNIVEVSTETIRVARWKYDVSAAAFGELSAESFPRRTRAQKKSPR